MQENLTRNKKGNIVSTNLLLSLFLVDSLAATLITLVSALSVIIGVFAANYLRGDSHYTRFFLLLGGATLSISAMVAADHLLVLLGAWGTSHYLLTRLMIHKPQWLAAANAGKLAGKSFLLGFASLTSAALCLYTATGETSIHTILATNPNSPLILVATILITLTAMTQSAIWPFHRWLLSSLNSPTPASAMMHAGFVNGGGVLLARFAPLYFSQPRILTVIFIIGIGSAFIGSLWKLMQSDIKRMLACSTMAQMGFMLAQCGLGLFAAAIAHLCWHGLFKANLFLTSNSAQQEKRTITDLSPSIRDLIFACIGGTYSAYLFLLASNQTWQWRDTTFLLTAFVFITGCQLTMRMVCQLSRMKLAMTFAILTLAFTSYGLSIRMIESIISPLNLMQAQPLNSAHILCLMLAIVMWLSMLYRKQICSLGRFRKMMAWGYVKALNASQPHASTMTPIRGQYQY
jgi:NAD(P)H-quinone oxidoreductase subunit 5